MVFKTALIIAGGKGTRLEEHTKDLPKPLVPLAGKPILERIIRWLKREGVNKIILGVAYKKEMIKDYFKDGNKFGVEIKYVEHDENGGTEDAFKTDIDEANIQDENFYAMNGDQITDLSLEKLASAHLGKNAIVTITTVNLKTNFGVVEIGEDGRVIEFKEKGEIPDKNMNSGIYVFNKKIKEYLQGGNIEENAFKKLIKDNKIHSFHYDGIWLTVNDKKELKNAEEFLKKLKIKMRQKIPMAKPSITEKEISYVDDAMRFGWGEKCYEYIKKFEDKFKEYIGSKFSLATSSCTGAINLALAIIGLKQGDEVIVADIAWITAITPITYFGGKPIFVDVLPDSWCIDPKKIEEAITPKTKAIIATHIYGNVADMDEIMKIAKKHNLYLIEDSAEALGSEYKGKKTGTIGDMGVFSFHGAKTCTTGEGGMLVTDNEELFRKASTLNNGGRKPGGKMFYAEIIGYKYKMSNFQAALGLAQIERVEELVERKRQIFYEYKKKLSGLPGISMNPEPSYTKNSFWLPTVIFDESLDIDRQKLIDFFKEKNVDIRPFFYPVSSLPIFEKNEKNKIAYGIYYRGINLPSYHDITDDDIDYVCELLKEFVEKKLSGEKNEIRN